MQKCLKGICYGKLLSERPSGEKWYEHYSSLSASAIPVIKWWSQEELTVSASKDLACLWKGQDTKINDSSGPISVNYMHV